MSRPPPFAVAKLDHVVLRAVDPVALVAFYRDVLGCVIERELADGLTQLRAGDALIDIVSMDSPLGRAGGAAPGAEGHNVDHLCLQIKPFDAAAVTAHLTALGVACGPPETRYGAGGYGLSIYLEDPGGNRLELRGPPSD